MKGPTLYGKAMGKSPVENEEVKAQQKTYEKMWTESDSYKNLTKANAPADVISKAKDKWSGKETTK